MIPYDDRQPFRLAWLRWVANQSRSDCRETEWGPARAIDGHVLAALAVGDTILATRRWDETLDLLAANLAYEALDPRHNKWHLADFALHPLLRAGRQFLAAGHPHGDGWCDRIRRLQAAVSRFWWHNGDLSENHNLLHWAAQCLVGEFWPELTLRDGRPAAAHRTEARPKALTWLHSWVEVGTEEWGADIYYNVNLLSLLNLADLSSDAALRDAARGTLDWMLADQALDRYGGALCGAARRSYAVYRQSLADSPSRPLQWLYWGDSPDSTAAFNLHFIGGVIVAAVSPWRPPPVLNSIARHTGAPYTHRSTHRKGAFGEWSGRPVSRTVGRHTWRSPHGLLSVLVSPGGRDRYTEHVWQATLGDEALVFSNHPFLHHGRWKGAAADAIRGDYSVGRPGVEKRYWVPGNMPPGQFGDIRPGYWQGNGYGPRSYGWENQIALVYDIPPDDPLPWVHLWFPHTTFDQAWQSERWLLARRGRGALAIWTSEATLPTDGTDLWREVERRLPTPRCALWARLDELPAATPADFFTWVEAVRQTPIHFDPQSCTLHVGTLLLDYTHGPRQGDRPLATEFARYESPWGRLDHGATAAVWQCGTTASPLGWIPPPPSALPASSLTTSLSHPPPTAN